MEYIMVGEGQVLRCSVRYYLIHTRKNKRSTYGISVCYRDERTTVEDISSDPDAVQMLLRQMMRNRVTPITVPDVVEDWLLR